ncbi:hypothetical protein [Tepidibacillus decaturensis]|uniref:Uncharacterized protein n=1 Tax=Tepidibacillus decaturensis TaxID=1413211 RepID=A0A135L1B0_9BACI|nr:hypothetical protein [Tepidibacillus decaturensis]KXG42657.1 hypothetical protein U473_00295 [Tepidibacillus decaturensis]
MYQFIIEQLDKVLKLHQEKKKALLVVSNTKTKRVGLYQLKLTAAEKSKMIHKVNNNYDSKIAVIYNNMNKKLKEAGYKELINPFEANTKGEINGENWVKKSH